MDISQGQLVYMVEQPELGPWRCVDRGPGSKTLTFESLWHEGERRHMLPKSAAFELYPIVAGARVLVAVITGGKLDTAEGCVAEIQGVGDGLREVSVTLDTGDIVESTELFLWPSRVADPTPIDTLRSLCWRGPYRFLARWRFHDALRDWNENAEGIPGFLGSRIMALGHQLYAAQRILRDRVPRFVLADEVGLGKTIEAGLVLQALMAEDTNLSVLIVAPGSMTRQWLCELYLRFGARAFAGVASGHTRQTREQALTNARTQPRVIASFNALAENEEVRDALLEREWGVVVVDEAHQIPPDHPLYDFLRRLSSESARGFLALSATPSKRELSGLLGLLSLVSPKVYEPEDTESLERLLAQKQVVWEYLHYTDQLLTSMERGDEDVVFSEVADTWREVLPGDGVVEELAERLEDADPSALEELIAYVQEYHRLDQRLIRTRRETLDALGQSWNERTFEIRDYSPSLAESELLERLALPPSEYSELRSGPLVRALLERVALTCPERVLGLLRLRLDAQPVDESSNHAVVASLNNDPGPSEEDGLIRHALRSLPKFGGEQEWLEILVELAEEWSNERDTCSRFEATRDALTSVLRGGGKALVFSQDADVAEALARYLSGEFGSRAVTTFYVGLDQEILNEHAHKFQTEDSCRILISDELGGEGRNFQVADVVVHLDVPWSVSRIEQRIGRLDRLGRPADKPVHSIVLCSGSSTERGLLCVHSDVFGVYERSVGGLEFVLPSMQRRINETVGLGARALGALADILTDEVEEARGEVNEEFELSLDSSRAELERASELAELIDDASGEDGEDWFDSFRAWASSVGLRFRSDHAAPGTVDVSWDQEHFEHEVRGLEPNGFMRGTFEREVAMRDDKVQYFAPGHKVVDAVAKTLEYHPQGRATVFKRSLGMRRIDEFFLVVLVRCAVDVESLRERGVSGGLLTRVRSVLWPEVEAIAFSLHPGKDTRWSPVTDPILIEALCSTSYAGKRSEPKLAVSDLAARVELDELWSCVEEAALAALAEVEARRRPIALGAAAELEAMLSVPRGYMSWSRGHAKSDAEREQIGEELKHFDAVIDAVKREGLSIEGLGVVVGSKE